MWPYLLLTFMANAKPGFISSAFQYSGPNFFFFLLNPCADSQKMLGATIASSIEKSVQDTEPLRPRNSKTLNGVNPSEFISNEVNEEVTVLLVQQSVTLAAIERKQLTTRVKTSLNARLIKIKTRCSSPSRGRSIT